MQWVPIELGRNQTCSTRTWDSDSSPTRVARFRDSDLDSPLEDSDLDLDSRVKDSDLEHGTRTREECFG
jgi:hypothetical protein